MVKVCRVITRLNIGGPAQHVVLLVRRIDTNGWSSTLVAGLVDPHEGDMLDLAYASGLRPVVIPTLRNGANLAGDLASFVHLYRLFRRTRPDIVHLHLFKARLLGGLAARLAGVPLVAETFHGTLFEEYFSPPIRWVVVVIERLLARSMHAIVAISEQVARELVDLRVATRDKLTVIPLGLDLSRFSEPARPATLRVELSIAEHVPLVGMVGRLVPIKGVSFFIAAAKQIVQQIPNAHFVVIGDGPDRLRLERQVDEAGLRDHVRFLGWRKDLERLYPDLDVVVLSSMNEGTPVAIIEAMAAGRPVVASCVGGVPDVIEDGVTGLLVPSKDPAALASAVVWLVTHAEARRRMGKAAREAVLPRFAAERLAADVEAFYRRLLCTISQTAAGIP
ncbi:MAG: glycosyltransferase family 4 protein [bacterium]